MFIPDGYGNLQWTFSTEAGQDALTSCGIRLATEWDPATVLTAAIGAFEDNLSEFIHDGFDGELVRLQAGTGTPGEVLVYEEGPWDGGTSLGAGLPPNVATLIKKLTPRGGRKGRGRMFLPPMGEEGVDQFGRLTESQYGALVTAADAFRTQLLTSAEITDLVVLHTDDLELPDVITTMVPSRSVVTQRRRLRT